MFSSIPALGRLLAAGAVLSILSIGLFSGNETTAPADIVIESSAQNTTLYEPFEVDVRLQASEPVNVFTGVVTFDNDRLAIQNIDYNTSVADLWAEEPWYSNGDGTLTFTGGTTKQGGLTGDESILRIKFTGTQIGETIIGMRGIEILRHDGLGTRVPTSEPIERIFTIAPSERASQTIAQKDEAESQSVTVQAEAPNTDLNNDGKQNLIDTSIFMTHLATQNLRSDFNQDGTVNLTDLSILNQ